ncbi:MAG: hypothetical protein NVSMB4_20280 [Acidimicrobiales bacterium]
MNRQDRRFAAGGIAVICAVTFCFLMACWHARTLDYGERWFATGTVVACAGFAAGITFLFLDTFRDER